MNQVAPQTDSPAKIWLFGASNKLTESLFEIIKNRGLSVTRIFNDDCEPNLVFGHQSWKGESEIKDFLRLQENPQLVFDRLADGILS